MLLTVAVTLAAAAACGAYEEEPSRPEPAIGGDASTDSPSAGDDAGQNADGGDDTTPTGCRAPGPPVLDTSFGTRPIPLSVPKMALEPSGRIAFVGVGDCGDGGTPALAMHVLLPDGGGAPSPAPCFGELEVARSIQATTNGYVITSVGTVAPSRARIRKIDARGRLVQLAEPAPVVDTSYDPTFALEIGDKLVWGGYREGGGEAAVGYVSIVAGSLAGKTPSFEDMIPVTAAVEDQTLYVAFTPGPNSASAKQLLLRKFSVLNDQLREDLAYSNNGRSRLDGLNVEVQRMEGLGSMIVRDGVVTIAIAHRSDLGVVEVFQFDGDAWNRLETLPGTSATAHVTTACDGVVTVGHGGPARLTRLEPDGGASLELAGGNSQVKGLARGGDGSMFVLVRASGREEVLHIRP